MDNENKEAETENKKNEKKQDRSNAFWKDAWDFIRTLLISMAAVFVIAHFIARPIHVEGNSMYPTLDSGSLGFSNVVGYKMNGIERFDVAIIYLKDDRKYLIKRVIGMPGDTVSFKDGDLYINGEMMEQDFLDSEYISSYPFQFTEDIAPITLGDDQYYCLGDNRPNSRDSRFYGPFTKDEIIAKGAFIFWPFRDFGVKTW